MRYALPFSLFALLPAALSAQNFYELDVNNVRARFYSHGLIGMDLANGTAQFEVPNGGGAHPLFSAGLWIGGMDSGNSLRMAAMCYEPLGSGDWFPGPLTVDGTASTTPAVQAAYDQVWPLDNSEVATQQAYCNCLSDPNCDPAVDFPGYQMPLWFNTWPAIGDVGSGFDLYQAPFTDYNSDGDYDPSDCDAPCGPGDGSLYFIFNDKGGVHLNSQGVPIGIEVQATPFAYEGPNAALANTVFVQYRIINRGTLTLSDAYISLFTDFDLGCAADDYVGCDVGRSLWYAYNGAADDAGAACVGGAQGYGTLPPAFGATILCGAFQDSDALDNPLAADYATAVAQAGSLYDGWGQGYGDNITDNERLGLSYFTYYDNSTGAMGNPVLANQYYGAMHALWSDGTPQTYGGNGYSGTIPARFAFPDDTDPLGLGVGGVPQPAWNEVSASNVPNDRRGVGTMGPITLEPGAINRILVAFTYARSNAGGPMNSVAELQARVDSIRAFADAQGFCNGAREDVPCFNQVVGINDPLSAEATITVHPVPTAGVLNITLPASLQRATLRIVDAIGRTVQAENKSNSVTRILDVSRLADGQYTVIAEHDGLRRYARFTKE
ncbi:MAG: T9SS type A sorting domain-containing protein [Flavobacteriales bacterium]|nr:T9SS type A sorting domain-containing protein [Flavobacteriales bacterium]